MVRTGSKLSSRSLVSVVELSLCNLDWHGVWTASWGLAGKSSSVRLYFHIRLLLIDDSEAARLTCSTRPHLRLPLPLSGRWNGSRKGTGPKMSMWSYRNKQRQTCPPGNTEPEERPGPGTPEETDRGLDTVKSIWQTEQENLGVTVKLFLVAWQGMFSASSR